MAKPKPTEKMERINFTLPESLKEEWEALAKSLRKPVAVMIKDAVREYRNNLKKANEPTVNPELQVLELKLEKMLDQKMQQFKEASKETSPTIEEPDNVDEIKGRILAMLEDLGPQSSAKLSTYLGIPRKLAMHILEEMQESNVVKIDKGSWSVA